jgi:hypothetical protein
MASLNDKIVAYLNANAVPFTEGAYHLGYTSQKGDHVVHWDEEALGAFPTTSELDAAYEAHMSAQKAVEYKILRAEAYPPIGDQLDALWKGGDAAADMLAQVQAVKAKYPKPE